jgi:hypothetical protein
MNISRAKVFRNSNHTWRITWAIGIALMLLSNLLGHHLYYVYYYFFVVGAISLINSLIKHSSIDDTKLSICYGYFFNRKRLNLPWSKIKSAQLADIEKSYIKTIGGRIRIPVKQTVSQKAIIIIFKDFSPLSETNNEKIHLNKMSAEMEIDCHNKELTLKVPPYGGFKRLLLEMGKHVPVNISPSDTTMLKSLYYALTAINALIFLVAIVLGVTL